VKGYAAGILNQFGSGVTILVLTSPEAYSDIHKETCLWLAENIEFSRPVESPVDEEWKNILMHARLTYLSSYSTSGGGSSSEANIHLCREGHFKYSSSSSMSLDVGGVFGSSAGRDGGNGEWNVTKNNANRPVLVLNFTDGRVFEYEITTEGSQTFLNGIRYFRTYDQTNCP